MCSLAMLHGHVGLAPLLRRGIPVRANGRHFRVVSSTDALAGAATTAAGSTEALPSAPIAGRIAGQCSALFWQVLHAVRQVCKLALADKGRARAPAC